MEFSSVPSISFRRNQNGLVIDIAAFLLEIVFTRYRKRDPVTCFAKILVNKQFLTIRPSFEPLKTCNLLPVVVVLELLAKKY